MKIINGTEYTNVWIATVQQLFAPSLEELRKNNSVSNRQQKMKQFSFFTSQCRFIGPRNADYRRNVHIASMINCAALIRSARPVFDVALDDHAAFERSEDVWAVSYSEDPHKAHKRSVTCNQMHHSPFHEKLRQP